MLFIAFIATNFLLHMVYAKSYKHLTLEQKIMHNFDIIKNMSTALLPWMRVDYVLINFSVAKMIMLQRIDLLFIYSDFSIFHLFDIHYCRSILDELLCIYAHI